MKKVLLILPLITALASALTLPPGGTDLCDPAAFGGFDPAVKSVQVWRIEVPETFKDGNYKARVSSVLAKDGFAATDFVLAVIKARVVGAVRGNLTAKIQQNFPPHKAACEQISFDIISEWAEYPLLFRPEMALEKGKGAILIFAGHLKQIVEVESVRVLRFPQETPVATFPRIRHTYPGREADAPWRAAALERIEQHRKKDLALVVTDASGQPLADREVKLVLRRHEFGFGSAVTASRFAEQTPDGAKYREVVDRLFSRVAFENDLKDHEWSANTPPERKQKFLKTLNQGFDWLEERKIPVRGHYLMQVPVSPNLAKVTDPAALRQHYISVTHERLDFVKDRVIEWDVINHPAAWPNADMLTARPGLEKLDRDIFNLARKKTAVPFFVNEDRIFWPGRQSDETYEYIKALNADGFKVDGLGNQAHFHASGLPSPEEMLAVTDRFAEIVPVQQITEYDIDSAGDESLAADFTRDALIACFSHPAYNGFLLWGFWEGSHWKKQCASWNLDWSIRERGKVLEEWIGERWRTRVTATTDADGRITWRGFPGWYEVTRADGGTVLVELSTAKPSTTTVAREGQARGAAGD